MVRCIGDAVGCMPFVLAQCAGWANLDAALAFVATIGDGVVDGAMGIDRYVQQHLARMNHAAQGGVDELSIASYPAQSRFHSPASLEQGSRIAEDMLFLRYDSLAVALGEYGLHLIEP